MDNILVSSFRDDENIEPKKILRFLEVNFDNIKVLYHQIKEVGSVNLHALENIFNNKETIDKLIKYTIVKENNDETYTLKKLHFNYISGLLDDYSLDMPEQISKYHLSLSNLYMRLKSSTEKNDIIETINKFIDEINEFEEQLKKNIKKLIQETKRIKANNENISYKQKVKIASELSIKYVNPLNIILQNHSDSTSSIIINTIDEANYQQFNNEDKNLQKLYYKLYVSFSQVKEEIINENRLLINEVVPLLERIKTESQILKGFINFLSNDKKYNPPILLESKIQKKSYSKSAYYNALDIWDGYIDVKDDVIIEDIEEVEDTWLYSEDVYTKLLKESLPNDNYYKWVFETLSNELEIVESNQFLQLSKIMIMTDGIEVKFTFNRDEIIVEDKIFNVPVVQIKEKL